MVCDSFIVVPASVEVDDGDIEGRGDAFLFFEERLDDMVAKKATPANYEYRFGRKWR
jgi:hypothetical protein